ncbi:MAG: FtsW/RodA/SpoVE family cell cycle protein [candidate division KSB1 bacterium]|nr:FtsW/RodA/SpoVE family cell cycle protein [candidate division KSB1 bacterium]
MQRRSHKELHKKPKPRWATRTGGSGTYQFDYVLLIAVLVLLAIGLSEVYSASSHTAGFQRDDPHFYVKSHLFRVLLGVLAMVGVFQLSWRHLVRAPWTLLWLSIGLLVLVLVMGVRVHGARRWLRLGVMGFEPSEFARFAMVVFVASKLAAWSHLRDWEQGTVELAKAFGATLVLAGLIVLQPDIDTAGLMIVVFLLMLTFAGVERGLVLMSWTTAISCAAVLMVVFGHFQSRVVDWLVFRFGWGEARSDAHTQVSASLAGLASGGLVRFNPGQGDLKYSFLPMAFSDFVFAIVGEEFGLVGALAVVGLFGVVVWRGMEIAIHAPSQEARLVAAGLTTTIGLYAVLNMLVVTGMAPTSGLPLPFVSYGGTAMVMNLAAVGGLLAISREAVQGAEGYLTSAGYRERLRLRGWGVSRQTRSRRF